MALIQLKIKTPRVLYLGVFVFSLAKFLLSAA